MVEKFYQEAVSLTEYTRGLRRAFHTYPELGFREIRTAETIARELRGFGSPVITGVAKTGVIECIRGEYPGPVVLLRFDMDALPIQEENTTEYTSQNAGVMHACGHDGHMAIGITAARILSHYRSQIHGAIKIVFQPAEEALGGAKAMLAEGLLQNPQVDYALSLHLMNEKPLGWAAIVAGPMMAGADIFTIKILGKGGHGATPHLTSDPIVAASQIVTAIQSIVSRNVPPQEIAVVSITSLAAGETYNVIPQVAHLKGTIRTYDSKIRDLVIGRLNQLAQSIATGYNCTAEIQTIPIAAPVVNNQAVTQKVLSSARRTITDLEIDERYQSLVSEDMAYVLEQVPGCYFLVGSANAAKGLDFPHHHPRFDFDESVLPRATALICSAAVALCGE